MDAARSQSVDPNGFALERCSYRSPHLHSRDGRVSNGPPRVPRSHTLHFLRHPWPRSLDRTGVRHLGVTGAKSDIEACL